MSVEAASGPICVALGCRKDAELVVRTEQHAQRVVCKGCAEGQVIGYV